MLMPYITMEDTKTSPFFSVIIPTLGKVDQWVGAIQSVLDQTCQDFEIVAVDSGPESVSRPQIERLADTRIIYVNTSAGNPRLNWDTGYRRSSGKYIVWMDDDNYLLPHALATLLAVIEKKGQPDIVTAEHVHYRSAAHYIPSYRNQLIINLPLFSNELRTIDPQDMVRRLMGWPQQAPERARFHMTETAVNRRIVEQLLARIKEINFETTSTHALRLGVLALSKSVYVIDTPIALVGQSGNALTDTWPKIDSPVLKEVKYSLKLSPLHVLTYANYRLENMLRTKQQLGEALAHIGPNMPKFIETYRRELIAFNQSWKDWYRNWKELTTVLQTHSEPEFAYLRRTHIRFTGISFGVQLARKMHLYGVLKSLLKEQRVSHNNAKTITLDAYGVRTIESCAKMLPTIIEKEISIPYSSFISSKL